MSNIKYSLELLKDTHDLLMQFRYFMSLNLVRAETFVKDTAGLSKVKELIRFSLDNVQKMDLFKIPLEKYEAENKEKLLNNFENLMKFFYDYLNYAEPIVNLYLKDKLLPRFLQVKQKYLEFHKKYLAP